MDDKFKKGVFYQIYPRSFRDSNGDGIGDLPGIIGKLDYLQSLGVSFLWLNPIYESPQFDIGYDVADYYKINPEYGTMDDFKLLLLEAKKRGMGVIMDLVVNHTSSEHVWFKKALSGDPEYKDYYIFRKGKRGNKPPNNWTSSFSGPAWDYVEGLDEWYLHLYGPLQPDLNWHNPKVLGEVENILRFYLDMGVAGFRCDVITQIYKNTYEDGKGHSPVARGKEHYTMTEGNHEILAKLYEDVFSHYDCVVIGEAPGSTIEGGKRFIDNKELDMFFSFEHVDIGKVLGGAFHRKTNPTKLRKILFAYQEGLPWNALYFENHDQRRFIERLPGYPEYRFPIAKATMALLLTLRGSPFIFQGQELGIANGPKVDFGQSRDCAVASVAKVGRRLRLPRFLINGICNNVNRDVSRVPFPWDGSPLHGFSSAKPWLPFALDDALCNAKDEENDAKSPLNFLKQLIRIREVRPSMTLGEFKALPSRGGLFAYIRSLGQEKTLIVINLTKKTVKLGKDIFHLRGEDLVGLGLDPRKRTLSPYGVLISCLD